MKSLESNQRKYALITGATSGFGYEFARLFARDGFNLVLVARTQDRLQEVAEELAVNHGIEARIVAEDLFEPEAAERIYKQTRAWGITIDVLVNDAGQGEHGKFIDYEIARDIDMIQLNITSLVSLTKFFLNDMVARNQGRILQVSSLLGKYPTPMMAVYAGTKAFVSSFTEALINELQGTNVTMTALLPGAADTDFFHKAGAENTIVYRETSLSDPQDVAKDGYEALMNGENRVISGAKNKVQAAMSTVLPDSTLASTMNKQMKPSETKEGREQITHPASWEERNRIEEATGKPIGDYETHEGHIHD